MLAAKPDEQSTVRDSIATLTPAQDIEMRRMAPNGDGCIAPKEARAEARLTAELRSSLSSWKKIALAILAFLLLSWIGNACLKADCESTPDSPCDAKTFLDDFSFGDAFDGDQKVSRRRLTIAKLTTAEILGEVHQNSTSLNTVDDLCALAPNSTKGSVAKLCKDMSGVGLDEKIYCGQEVLKEIEEAALGSAPPEGPSFTMREVLTSADTEQTYNAVVDRC